MVFEKFKKFADKFRDPEAEREKELISEITSGEEFRKFKKKQIGRAIRKRASREIAERYGSPRRRRGLGFSELGEDIANRLGSSAFLAEQDAGGFRTPDQVEGFGFRNPMEVEFGHLGSARRRKKKSHGRSRSRGRGRSITIRI